MVGVELMIGIVVGVIGWDKYIKWIGSKEKQEKKDFERLNKKYGKRKE